MSFRDDDLEYWMTHLPEPVKDLPIAEIAIPGSHNSASYTITRSSALGSDAFDCLRTWNSCCGPCLRGIVYNWVVNQNATITEQLMEGVRYLDFRLGSKPGTDRIHIVHGLYGDAIDGFLGEVKSFLDTHREEIVIIDFQHFYKMNFDHHAVVEGLLDDLFNKKMCPFYYDMTRITINYMLKKGYQLIVVYRDHGRRQDFWPGEYFATCWPDTKDIRTMINELENAWKIRSEDSSHVSQCILTPDGTFILFHLCSSLESSMAAPCNSAVIPWLENQMPGRTGLNIVISDFIKMHGIPFCETVVRLNYKYLDEY